MKTTVKRYRNSTAKGSRRGKGACVVKFVKNTGSGKKKVYVCDWQHLTKQDADIIVRLLNNPHKQNEAVKTVEPLYQSIQQLD